MAQPQQSLPTILRVNSGLDEVAQPQQSLLGLAGLDDSLLSKAQPQQNNISSPVGEDKGGVQASSTDGRGILTGGVTYVANDNSMPYWHGKLAIFFHI